MSATSSGVRLIGRKHQGAELLHMKRGFGYETASGPGCESIIDDVFSWGGMFQAVSHGNKWDPYLNRWRNMGFVLHNFKVRYYI